MIRDKDFEQTFIGGGDFANTVIGRLDEKTLELGNKWTALRLVAFVNELEEEALDFGGWGLLLSERLKTDGSVEAQKARVLVREIMDLGRTAYGVMPKLRECLQQL